MLDGGLLVQDFRPSALYFSFKKGTLRLDGENTSLKSSRSNTEEFWSAAVCQEDQEDQQQNAPDRDAVEKSLIHVGTQADDKHRNPPTLEVRKFLEAGEGGGTILLEGCCKGGGQNPGSRGSSTAIWAPGRLLSSSQSP